MILKSKHHIVIYPLFKWLTLFLLKRRFNEVKIVGSFNDTGESVLVIANHIGWWDGFWLMYLNLKCIHRKFHFMMLEEQLKKHWYFQFTGAYSVKKGSRSAMESLKYSNELLSRRDNMVFMFPQGKIKSLYHKEMNFEKGIDYIIKNASADMQVVFVANMIDYFSNSRPGVYMYIQRYTAQQLKLSSIETEYAVFYQKAFKEQESKSC